MRKQKRDFIKKVCEECGCEDLVLSEISLKANYGSKYDGERIHYHLCGECFDNLVSCLSHARKRHMSMDEIFSHQFVIQKSPNKRKVERCCCCDVRVDGTCIVEFDNEELGTVFLCPECRDELLLKLADNGYMVFANHNSYYGRRGENAWECW